MSFVIVNALVVDIDDCAGNNQCGSHGSCVDGVNSFTCNCVTGYTGDFCANSKLSLFI